MILAFLVNRAWGALGADAPYPLLRLLRLIAAIGAVVSFEEPLVRRPLPERMLSGTLPWDGESAHPARRRVRPGRDGVSPFLPCPVG